MSAKKVPLRMCIGCREMKPKTELWRIVKTPSGEIERAVKLMNEYYKEKEENK